MYVLTIICCLITAAYGQSIGIGPCPIVKASKTIEIDKYFGKWYEWKRSDYLGGICSSSTWTKHSDTKITVVHRSISKITNLESGIIGYVTINDEKVNVKYNISMGRNIEVEYRVLDTDYDNFSILWSCSNYKFVHYSHLSVHIRNLTVEPDTSKIEETLKKAGVISLPMRKVDHSNCP
ncbi:apolipoprotein D [Microplitis demolitor]|uniref:apolipoprotein D n=1 Tax=Microplitis demolitor TaxID=69319 RepID=UPI0004CCE9C0|nr:apolipoprotein D [Microplitis demolitor]